MSEPLLTAQRFINEGDGLAATTEGRHARPCLPSMIAGLS